MRARIAIKLTLGVAAAFAAACSGTGTGGAVRTDITARMQSIAAPVQMCYAVALERNRRLRGMVVLSFRAAPGSGQFDQITVTRDDVGDEQVRKCVVDAVGTLKLAAPQKTAVTVSYPLNFEPSK